MDLDVFAFLHPLSAALFIAPFALVVSVIAFVHEFGHLIWSAVGSA